MHGEESLGVHSTKVHESVLFHRSSGLLVFTLAVAVAIVVRVLGMMAPEIVLAPLPGLVGHHGLVLVLVVVVVVVQGRKLRG